jgi:hypothetical protein
MKLLLAVFVVFACLPGTALGQLPDSAQGLIEHYRALIRSAESSSSPVDLEPAFAALQSIEQALLHNRNGSTVLAYLSDEEYQRLQHDLVGAIVFRGESEFVVPDPDYFIKLAAVHGEESDRAFWAAFKATYPQAAWPVYIEQQTDYSGCTRFGSMSLVGTYGLWTDFGRRYPGRYGKVVNEQLEAVLQQLTASTCACGDLRDVEKELRGFVREFRKSPGLQEIERRLDELRSGKLNIRERCISG